MSERRDFLFELGTEELPPKSLGALEAALRDGITKGLADASLQHGAIDSFATPRRLAVRVRGLSTQQPEQQIRRRGPPVRAAFDAAGMPTRAAQAFAESCGAPLASLGRERDDKGNEYLNYSGTKPGAAAASLLPGIISAALDALPIPKRMRWGAGEAQFVRPVHWLVMLHGKALVPATLLGVKAGRATRGHRFHAPRQLPLAMPASYEKTLLSRGKVVAGFASRRERIHAQVTKAATKLGGRAIFSDELLDEVTALVEWPVALAGQFDERFLSLPREVLVATLQDHQRYFAVEGKGGKLLPAFITVSNIQSRKPDVVRSGNERVVRPRLTDAAFFWKQDRRAPLSQQVGALDRVTYQAQLGSIGDKARRIAELAATLATTCGAEPKRIARAAALCKCDLLTAMVGEFPELQGTMGAYYAQADGEDTEVVSAIREHYLPRGAGDALPATPTGLALALADRIDTLCGIFAIGQKPSGTRDPFGLRRAAIGVLRMGRERALDFDLRAALGRSVAAQPVADIASRAAAVGDEVHAYVMERLRAQYLEDSASGVSTEIFDAVLATLPRSLPDFNARLAALVEFLKLPEAASLAAANKRIANILRKSAATASVAIDASLLAAPPERALHAELLRLTPTVDAALARGDYRGAFTALAQLKGAVDAFFDGVMVNDPDAKLRDNRLALLGALRALFVRIADLSRLPG